MFGPLLIDQFFIYLIGMLTTSMISSSSQESVSAVSLVSPLTYMIIALSNAVASGGTVVVAQYKGKGDQEKMRRAAGQVVFASFMVALATCTLLLVVSDSMVNWMFGTADAVIREKATAYTIGFGISLIPFSLYNGICRTAGSGRHQDLPSPDRDYQPDPPFCKYAFPECHEAGYPGHHAFL